MILGVYDVIYIMTSRMTSQLRYYPIWRQNTKYGGRSLRLSCNDHLVTYAEGVRRGGMRRGTQRGYVEGYAEGVCIGNLKFKAYFEVLYPL